MSTKRVIDAFDTETIAKIFANMNEAEGSP